MTNNKREPKEDITASTSHADDGLHNSENPNMKRCQINKGLKNYLGYAGTFESCQFPVRQYFVTKYGVIPSQWTSGWFLKPDISRAIEYVNEIEVAIKMHTNSETAFAALYEKKSTLILLESDENWQQSKDSIYRIKYYFTVFFVSGDENAKEIIDGITELTPKKTESPELSVSFITQDRNGFSLSKKIIPKESIDISENYNDDFAEFHLDIMNKLKTKKTGIVLLHGHAGTGKTTYLKYLLSELNQPIIYCPPNLTSEFSSPAMVGFITSGQCDGAIIIMEDSENVLMKRDGSNSQSVSNILNLSDGIFGEIANIRIICTFNAEISKIDDAIMRKGRLIGMYEFKPLTEDKTELLAKKLGVQISGERTLAEIYNANEINYQKTKPSIGFKN